MKKSPFRQKTEEELEELRRLPLSRKKFMREFRIGNSLYDELIRKPDIKYRMMRESALRFEEYCKRNRTEVEKQYIRMNIDAFRELHNLSERATRRIMGMKRAVQSRYRRIQSTPYELISYRMKIAEKQREMEECKKREDYWRSE